MEKEATNGKLGYIGGALGLSGVEFRVTWRVNLGFRARS